MDGAIMYSFMGRGRTVWADHAASSSLQQPQKTASQMLAKLSKVSQRAPAAAPRASPSPRGFVKTQRTPQEAERSFFSFRFFVSSRRRFSSPSFAAAGGKIHFPSQRLANVVLPGGPPRRRLRLRREQRPDDLHRRHGLSRRPPGAVLLPVRCSGGSDVRREHHTVQALLPHHEEGHGGKDPQPSRPPAAGRHTSRQRSRPFPRHFPCH